MKYIATFLAAAATAASAGAANGTPVAPEIPVENLVVEQNGTKIELSMDLAADRLRPGKDREYTITPVLVSADGHDSILFEPVTVAGHNLYYLHDRQGDLEFERIYRAGHTSTVAYSQSIEAPEWIENAELRLDLKMRNCCDITRLPAEPLGNIELPRFTPVPDYGEPIPVPTDMGPKLREIDGRAYINFPVNRTELYPEYMNNPAELSKIIATIDSVKNDSDITVDSIFIKGYASPEGSYSNNIRLAKGRTATLKDYVERMYAFPAGFIQTDYEPEDWAGLREYVESSKMLHRDAILDIIDSNLQPDPKNTALQRRFPTEYAMLLANVYPSLRHSDYSIFYTIRTFTDPKEILALTKTAPQKLSIDEVRLAAAMLKPGSPESNDLYETAARMYPDDTEFALGAANAAIARGDYRGAQAYLDRAGDSARAVYTRGVLAASQGDYDAARTYYEQAARLGAPYATEALEKIKNIGNGKLRIVPAEPQK